MSSDDELPSNVVALESGLSLRFYEAVLLLYCLKEVMYEAKSVKEPDLESDVGRSSRDSFRCFVNKLAQICDNELGGRTVTAFAVLQPGQTQYRFASNQRSSGELEDVKTYVSNILGTLGGTPDDKLSGVVGTVLESVLAFNRPVIEQYAKNLFRVTEFCARVCGKEDNAKVINQAVELLDTISKLYNSSFEGFIRDKAHADRDPGIKTPWSELRHAFGRLHSYTIAVKVLVSMRRRRQELFENFEIVAVPSSARSSCPNVRRKVDRILDRFPPDMKIGETYKTNLPEELRDVMDKMVKKCGTGKKGKFRPYVHAELLLLNSILTEEEREGATLRFFGGADYDRYIGCSKPTCRLCKLYIDSHPSGVEFRGGHGNIYHEWRAPDICNDEGVNVEKAKKIRQSIHNKMLDAIRQRIQTTLDDRAIERKNHDSNSTPTSYIGAGRSTCNPHLGAQAAIYGMDSISTTGAVDDSDDVATPLGRLTIAGNSDRSGSRTSISRSSQDTTPVPDSNAASPNGLSLKAVIDRRQRPLIIEADE